MKHAIVNRREGFQIEAKWLELFASKVKDRTGKYLVGRFKWENFADDLQPAVVGSKAYEYYRDQKQEDYYLFNESVSEVWDCNNESFPESAPGSGDWYVFPKSGYWTMVFSHEGTAFFSKKET
jgi:hypothetical protein